MTPLFTIITPTVQRPSLAKCCASVTSQSTDSWEHIVIVDCETMDWNLLADLEHPQRKIIQCETPHCNSGNTCRHNAWEFATGKRLFFLDDDNYLADDEILADIATTLMVADEPDWATFPILRFGGVFFNDPPGLCLSDTLNVVVKREIGRWPNINDYTADGHWINALRDHDPAYTFKAFPNFRPIGVMPVHSKGAR